MAVNRIMALVRTEDVMKNQRIFAALTLVNLGILIFLLLNYIRPVEASTPATVLRGRGLEIIDAQGKVRASIQLVLACPGRGQTVPL
jgi:hypothetical protein